MCYFKFYLRKLKGGVGTPSPQGLVARDRALAMWPSWVFVPKEAH